MVDGFREFLDTRFCAENSSVLDEVARCAERMVINKTTNLCDLLNELDILFVENGAFALSLLDVEENMQLYLMQQKDLWVNVFGCGEETTSLGISPSETGLVSILRYEKILQIEDPEGRAFLLYLSLFEMVVSKQQEFEGMFLRERARGRYEILLVDYPGLFQHFRLKDIASFMGISQVSLSRLRRRD
ncbi:MAG: hypothetical protein WBP58_08915 [Chitinophagaceae bacterium]